MKRMLIIMFIAAFAMAVWLFVFICKNTRSGGYEFEYKYAKSRNKVEGDLVECFYNDGIIKSCIVGKKVRK